LRDIKIGEKIKQARKSWGLSQMELAERLGISFQQIQKYEKDATRISVIRLHQISEALGMDIFYFFENEKKTPNLTDSSIKYVPQGDAPHNLLPLDKEEITLLKLFRKIKNKKLRECIFNQLKGIIAIENISR